MKFCHHCHVMFWPGPKSPERLCPDCFLLVKGKYHHGREFWQIRQGILVQSILPYRGWFREQCLRAKVDSDFSALELLIELLCFSPMISLAMHDIDVITPVPSSLWGRINGRFDLAMAIADHLARVYQKKLVLLPNAKYFWRLVKRSRLSRHAKVANTRNRPADEGSGEAKPTLRGKAQLGRLRVLVVDDVVTTGFSLKSAGDMINGPMIQYLALFQTG